MSNTLRLGGVTDTRVHFTDDGRAVVERNRLDSGESFLEPVEPAHHAVVREQPIAVHERVAVGLLHGAARRRTHVREEHARFHLCRDLAQVPHRGLDRAVPPDHVLRPLEIAVALVEDPGLDVQSLGGDAQALGDAPEDLGTGLAQSALDLAEEALAEARAVGDLTGVLAAAGQVVTVGDGARLSVVVDQPWRAEALAEMIDEAGTSDQVTVAHADPSPQAIA